MKYLQPFTYYMVLFAILVHHIPYLRASFDIRTDIYYHAMAEDLGLWE